jgi:hypothetical protein
MESSDSYRIEGSDPFRRGIAKRGLGQKAKAADESVGQGTLECPDQVLVDYEVAPAVCGCSSG